MDVCSRDQGASPTPVGHQSHTTTSKKNAVKCTLKTKLAPKGGKSSRLSPDPGKMPENFKQELSMFTQQRWGRQSPNIFGGYDGERSSDSPISSIKVEENIKPSEARKKFANLKIPTAGAIPKKISPKPVISEQKVPQPLISEQNVNCADNCDNAPKCKLKRSPPLNRHQRSEYRVTQNCPKFYLGDDQDEGDDLEDTKQEFSLTDSQKVKKTPIPPTKPKLFHVVNNENKPPPGGSTSVFKKDTNLQGTALYEKENQAEKKCLKIDWRPKPIVSHLPKPDIPIRITSSPNLSSKKVDQVEICDENLEPGVPADSRLEIPDETDQGSTPSLNISGRTRALKALFETSPLPDDEHKTSPSKEQKPPSVAKRKEPITVPKVAAKPELKPKPNIHSKSSSLIPSPRNCALSDNRGSSGSASVAALWDIVQSDCASRADPDSFQSQDNNSDYNSGGLENRQLISRKNNDKTSRVPTICYDDYDDVLVMPNSSSSVDFEETRVTLISKNHNMNPDSRIQRSKRHDDYDDVEVDSQNIMVHPSPSVNVKSSIRLDPYVGDTDSGCGSTTDLHRLASDDHADLNSIEGDEGWVDWAEGETETSNTQNVVLRNKKSKDLPRQRHSAELQHRLKRNSGKARYSSNPERTSVSYEYDDVKILLDGQENTDNSEWEDVAEISSSSSGSYEDMSNFDTLEIRPCRKSAENEECDSNISKRPPMPLPRCKSTHDGNLHKSVPPPFDLAPILTLPTRGHSSLASSSDSVSTSIPVNIPSKVKIPCHSDEPVPSLSSSSSSSDCANLPQGGNTQTLPSGSRTQTQPLGGDPVVNCTERPPPLPRRKSDLSSPPPLPPSRRRNNSSSESPLLRRNSERRRDQGEAPPLPFRRRDSNGSLSSVASNGSNLGDQPPLPPRGQDGRHRHASEPSIEPPPTPPRSRPTSASRVKELTPDTVVPVLHTPNGELKNVKMPPKRALPPPAMEKLSEGLSTPCESPKQERDSFTRKMLRHSSSAGSLLAEVPPPPPYRPKEKDEESEGYGYIPPDPNGMHSTPAKREGYMPMDSVEGAGFSSKRRQSQPIISPCHNGEIKRRSSVGNYIDPLFEIDSHPLMKSTPVPFSGLWADKRNSNGSNDSQSRPNYLQLLEDEDEIAVKELEQSTMTQGRNSILFEDEPLYQQYTSQLIARGLLDSRICEENSSGEDEELYSEAVQQMVTDAIVDKENFGNEMRESLQERISAGTAMRTLWGEMPKVLKSGLLERISTKERKCQEALFEILSSESSYLKSLNLLVNHFYLSEEFALDHPLGIIDRRSKTNLFSNILSVRNASQKFMEELEELWHEDCYLNEKVLKVVSNYIYKDFQVYINYCCNKEYQNRMLAELVEKNRLFSAALEKLEAEACCRDQKMHSFLVLPMQRVLRLPLLLKAVIDNADSNSPTYSIAVKTHSDAVLLAKECEERAQKMSNLETITKIFSTLDFKNMKTASIVSMSRSLVKMGNLQRIIKESSGFLGSLKRKETLHLILFSDILLITKKKSERSSIVRSDLQYQVLDYAARNSIHVQRIEAKDIPQCLPNGVPSGCKFVFLMALLENHQSRDMEYYFMCDTLTELLRWIEALTPNQQIGDEKIYEAWDMAQVQVIYNYEAKEPDEISLQESEVINVYRKMSDGWYEGERVRDGMRGWFPSNHTVEIQNDHVRAKKRRQQYRQKLAIKTGVEEIS